MKKLFKEYFIIFIGLLLVALEITYIMIPNNIVSGGIGGLAIVINHFFTNISVGFIMLILNIILFIIAFVFLGGEFGVKTIICSLSLSSMVWVLQKFFPIHKSLSDDLLAQLILASIMASLGLALVFYENASTGGTDIIAKILNKFFRLSIGKAVLISDLLIVLSSVFVFGFKVGIYGFLGLLLNGLLIDYIILNINSTQEIIIISNKSKKIMNFIHKEFNQSATIYQAFDANSNEKRDVIRIILMKKGYLKLKKYVNQIDNMAYITSHSIEEIQGFRFMV
ncbi:YitT family protein [Clostridium grantii]|uniref:Uncharacterized membrane-anchored protein YitT, contains DUF161 and DUF2179 domains n=1 Tax=Clostridium grantii DSM 8605 TaxID=1121316 RepID=A0A1M5S4J6_9CLOT|nr:YitT family protein [Clostridium grantii]SHH32883.1 Uncharacterized membrane-anchored protein YitT, contains DUF161 and DUF2179 domains [Clostridium grantii DSM 8605]